jgi:hypothetical protein
MFAIGSLARLHRKSDRCRSNYGERAHRWRGASEGKCSGTHGGLGVAGVGEERGRGGVTAENRGGRRRSEGCRRRSGGLRAGGRRGSSQGASTR